MNWLRVGRLKDQVDGWRTADFARRKKSQFRNQMIPYLKAWEVQQVRHDGSGSAKKLSAPLANYTQLRCTHTHSIPAICTINQTKLDQVDMKAYFMNWRCLRNLSKSSQCGGFDDNSQCSVETLANRNCTFKIFEISLLVFAKNCHG